MERTVVIVAGGSGTRMGANCPKQFLEVNGKAILEHTMSCFYQFDRNMEMIIVLPKDQIDIWSQYCKENKLEIPHMVIHGGESRFHSVKNGLSMVKKRGVVAIHDGVRPCVSQLTLHRCFDEATTNGAVVPVVALVDSIRQLKGDKSTAVDRSQYALVQTPQTFQWDIISNAYKQNFDPLFTDDASVVEKLGVEMVLVEGNRENIKVTTPADLKWIVPFL
ncbi:2-C-methyl-D-erythritol 4-phosphate cytidylyltransferase [Halosquirtibacter xylanolyticus]|uniref:2-C-methyl-D-erythritol 4-phosphate cytidylyltransferase n=1 Tax=Halosquirtibacter xylanolyticus TaxID=3374599 RepID=UPI003749DC7F|nr:2-C-methyl-D-erythritol 4-phosphate cytidylyltransferase [Prolixibacteraceae bacterium]